MSEERRGYEGRAGSFTERFLGKHTDVGPTLRALIEPEVGTGATPGKRFKTRDIDGTTFFIVEGDLMLDEDQFERWAAMREQEVRAFLLKQAARFREGPVASAVLGDGQQELTGIVDARGRFIRWPEGTVLSYRVIHETFTSDDNYTTAVNAVRQAIDDWMATCNVKFEHLVGLDDRPGLGKEGALFTVRQFNADGDFIAMAFFPDDPPARRKVLLDPSFYTTTFDRVGVLRHELGHVLGFRHEQIRSAAPPVCQGEPWDNAAPLTAYDPRSVMHYFCGGAGTRELAITEFDTIGAQRLYGRPANQLSFAEV